MAVSSLLWLVRSSRGCMVPQVQLQLVTATVKLFLKKPTEKPQAMIQLVLTYATQETDNPDLRDRACAQRPVRTCYRATLSGSLLVLRSGMAWFEHSPRAI